MAAILSGLGLRGARFLLRGGKLKIGLDEAVGSGGQFAEWRSDHPLLVALDDRAVAGRQGQFGAQLRDLVGKRLLRLGGSLTRLKRAAVPAVKRHSQDDTNEA